MSSVRVLAVGASVASLALLIAAGLGYFALYNEAMLSARLTPSELDEILRRLFGLAISIFIIVAVLAVFVGLIFVRFVDVRTPGCGDPATRFNANVKKGAFTRNAQPVESWPMGRASRSFAGLASGARRKFLTQKIASSLIDLRETAAHLNAEGGRADQNREVDQINLANEHTSVFELLAQIQSAFDVFARAKALEFSVHYEYPVPETILIDACRLKQILAQLVSNAIKYTDEGEVHIRVRYLAQVVIFEVTDTGIGLTKSQLDTFFKPTPSPQGSLTDPFCGCHLRMNYARAIAKQLGGDLTVRSLSGQGSCFTLAVNCAETVPLNLVTARPHSFVPIAPTAHPVRGKPSIDEKSA